MPRGRPRKPDPLAWLNDPPEWIQQFPYDNLEGIHEYIKQETELLRRGEASYWIRAAYKDGRNQANANRQREKVDRQLNFGAEFEDLIAKRMSAASVAAIIKRNKPETELSERTLRGYVTEIRKLAEPYRKKK